MKKLLIPILFITSCTQQPDTSKADKIFNEAINESDKNIRALNLQSSVDSILGKMAADPEYDPTQYEKNVLLQADTTYINQ